jgi:hypothetical protein
VSLPPRRVLWSASLAGGPVRPGVGATAACCCRCRRARERGGAGVRRRADVPAARRRLGGEGDAHVELPAVDLPCRGTGLTLHHSPRYEVEPKPGAFRVESDADRGARRFAATTAARPPPRRRRRTGGRVDAKDSSSLMDRFQKEPAARARALVPIAIAFPQIGPSVFSPRS